MKLDIHRASVGIGGGGGGGGGEGGPLLGFTALARVHCTRVAVIYGTCMHGPANSGVG